MLPDFTGILDALGEDEAVVVGHDWGSALAWSSAALYPDRFRAVVGMSVPHLGRGPMAPTTLLKTVFQDNWFYILYFQEPGVAEAEFETDVRATMRTILAGIAGFDTQAAPVISKKKGDKFLTGISQPDVLPDWLTEEDVDYFTSQFEKTGFRGGLNRYRNMDRDWEQVPELGERKIEQPALFLTGDKDPVKSFAPVDAMKAMVPGLRDTVEVPGGHWIQQEQPALVNDALLKFLKSL